MIDFNHYAKGFSINELDCNSLESDSFKALAAILLHNLTHGTTHFKSVIRALCLDGRTRNRLTIPADEIIKDLYAKSMSKEYPGFAKWEVDEIYRKYIIYLSENSVMNCQNQYHRLVETSPDEELRSSQFNDDDEDIVTQKEELPVAANF